jgi:hypothetical protein
MKTAKFTRYSGRAYNEVSADYSPGIPNVEAIAVLLADARKLATAEGLDDGVDKALIDISDDDRLHGLRTLIDLVLETKFAFADAADADGIALMLMHAVNEHTPAGDEIYIYCAAHIARR